MKAAVVSRFDRDEPLRGLEVGERPTPSVPDSWELVEVRAVSLNHHDLWSLRGVGLSERQLPRILGTDAAGVTADGTEVIVHAVIGDLAAGGGDETLDPARTLLSEAVDGTLASYVAVPSRNLVPKPAWMSFEQAACLPTAWLTAYRMLFTVAQLRPGQSVLVQGVGGGVATAAISLAAAAGLRVFATARTPQRSQQALQLGATFVGEPGARLPERMDAVIETVGAATWGHSIRSLRPGGTLVCSGATTGDPSAAELNHIFFRQLRVLGSTMGTRSELQSLVTFMGHVGLGPVIDAVFDWDGVTDAFARLSSGEAFGKVVVRV